MYFVEDNIFDTGCHGVSCLGPVPPLRLDAIICIYCVTTVCPAPVASWHSQRTHLHITNTMTNKSIKTPYTFTVRKNILKMILKTKQNIHRLYLEIREESFVQKIYFNEETEDEEEQNRFNEALERKLKAA